MNDLLLPGRHALITGGRMETGLAIAGRLPASGTEETICGRDSDRLPRAAADKALHAVQIDITEEASVRRATQAAAQELGPVNIHVANAGIA